MADLAPRSDRTKGFLYARVHAAQARLPALIFVAPEFSIQEQHPENYSQYYHNAEIIKLPPNADDARASILNRIEESVQAGKKIHTILINAHGLPGGLMIGGLQSDPASVLKLLSNIADIRERTGGKPIADNIVLASCDILASATDVYLNRLVSIQQKLGANIVAAGNVTYGLVADGKAESPFPQSGRYYQITRYGFSPYFDFRGDSDLVKHGDQEAALYGFDATLAEQRVAMDKNNCATDTSAQCAGIKADYTKFAAYQEARWWLYSHPDARGDEAKPYVETVKSVIPQLPDINRPEAYLEIVGHTPTGSPMQIDAIDQALRLMGRGFEKTMADQVLRNTPLNPREYIVRLGLGADHDPRLVMGRTAQYLSNIEGLPNEFQMQIWAGLSALATVEKKLDGAIDPHAKAQLERFESDTEAKLTDGKYTAADRMFLAGDILRAKSSNDRLNEAAKNTVRMPRESDLIHDSNIVLAFVYADSYAKSLTAQNKQTAPDQSQQALPKAILSPAPSP